MYAVRVQTAEDIGRMVPDLNGVYFGKCRIAAELNSNRL